MGPTNVAGIGMGGYASIVPQVPPGSKPPDTPHFERLLTGAHSAYERLVQEAEHLESIAERFLGLIPADPSASAPAQPSSLVEHFDGVVSRIHAVTDRISAVRLRLQRL